jgi:hypothetical protein
MIRSLGLVLLVVVPIWFLAQPPASDEAELRVVDPTADIRAFADEVPQAPVPGVLSERWRATSSTYLAGQQSLRVGYVTPDEQYAEYAASTAPAQEFLETVVGEDAERLAPVRIDGTSWDRYRDEDGSLSLARSYGGVTVVVGTHRATAQPAELEVLLRSLTRP